MFDINITVGPINVGITTDERLSLDFIDTLINKAVFQTMVLDTSHMGNMIKYDNYDNDNECDQCNLTTGPNEELD
jgi:hypothetical protein